MITHFGYTDGSGKYYISIDAEKCNSCGDCLKQCPKAVFELTTVMIDIEDKTVASVKEEFRKKIKYTCDACKQEKKFPCILACKQNAISIT